MRQIGGQDQAGFIGVVGERVRFRVDFEEGATDWSERESQKDPQDFGLNKCGIHERDLD